MKLIFGKKTKKSYGKMGDLVAEMVKPRRSPFDRALGRNLMYDDRVSALRAEQFYRWAGRPGTELDFRNSLDDYLLEQVRPHPAHTFLDLSRNRRNLVSEGPEFLANVIDLNGLSKVLTYGGKLGIDELRDAAAADLTTDTKLNLFLDERLVSSARDSFVAAILESMRSYRLVAPRNPTWAADWNGFSKCIDKTPESWLEAVGVARLSHPRWIVVLKYPSAGLRLARPTQLEAGSYAYHYPTPWSIPVSNGGHPMSLFDNRSKRTALVSEFIHPEIDFMVEHWRASDSLCAKTGRGVGVDLARSRRRHYTLLRSSYGEQRIKKWMGRCL